jgi:hypothetical protein
VARTKWTGVPGIYFICRRCVHAFVVCSDFFN